ncbi:MAG: T9SS type A sorting domain-containing protein, partial [Flavobacteriales bacterium]|nr:T9SS type A sorting domain-containing protein [Flavobacteriales bacterium]
PTTDKILLSSAVDYQLFSLKGELILEGNASSIEVSKLSKGVYFLNTKIKTFKIIKE